MGIQGLLPFLKDITSDTNISDFKGKVAAVDAYGWLHKGAFACVEKLAYGDDTDMYANYCMKMFEMLLSKGVKPIAVFDGCHLPAKEKTEKNRRQRRSQYREKASEAIRTGNQSEVRKYLERCVDITPAMAHTLIQKLRQRGIDYIVAPYEADAQLAYLSINKLAEVIITEDSDLLPFGAQKVLYKLDINGNGKLVCREDLHKVVQRQSTVFTFDKFRHMCILAGCDYLENLPGIGIGKAYRICRMSCQADLRIFLRNIPMYLKSKSIKPSPDYIEDFIKADNAFRFQLVFNPRSRSLVPLNPYEEGLDISQLDYCGPQIPDDQAFHIAIGNIDVSSKKVIDQFDPDNWKITRGWHDSSVDVTSGSIWGVNFGSVNNTEQKTSRITIPRLTGSDFCQPESASRSNKGVTKITEVFPKRSKVNNLKRKASFEESKSTQKGSSLESDDVLLEYATKQVKSDLDSRQNGASQCRPKSPIISSQPTTRIVSKYFQHSEDVHAATFNDDNSVQSADNGSNDDLLNECLTELNSDMSQLRQLTKQKQDFIRPSSKIDALISSYSSSDEGEKNGNSDYRLRTTDAQKTESQKENRSDCSVAPDAGFYIVSENKASLKFERKRFKPPFKDRPTTSSTQNGNSLKNNLRKQTKQFKVKNSDKPVFNVPSAESSSSQTITNFLAKYRCS